MLSPTWSTPAATNQPNTSPTGIWNASAWTPPDSGTGACGLQPDCGAPAAASRAGTPAAGSTVARGPPAQATTRPGSHETWSWVTPSGTGRRPSGGAAARG